MIGDEDMKKWTRSAACVWIVALLPTVAHGQVDRSRLNSLTVGQLKTRYLACDSAAMRGELGSGAIAGCSVVYEELKQRGFGGDFGRLLTWSKSQPGVAAR
jgi:hypothetical protein